MLNGYKIYDADAHVFTTPEMWADLPAKYHMRRPRPVRFGDSADLGMWTSAWLVDGQVEPRPLGPGTHAANTPGMVLADYGAEEFRAYAGLSPVACGTLTDVQARIDAIDRLGIDVQMLFPSTIMATMTTDPGFEAALFRGHNRYFAEQCAKAPKRLRWAGLVPMRDTKLALETVAELKSQGAAAFVVFGTVGEKMLSDESFEPIWDAMAASGLPVCVHMAMSYPPFSSLCHSIMDANMIGKAMPAQLAFVAIFSHGILHKYPKLKIGFLEFGGEWIFYSVGRMEHYTEVNRGRMPDPSVLSKASVKDLVRSGRFFLGMEAEDEMIPEEIKLLGDGALMYSSDFPHDEGRDNAAEQLISHPTLTETQKRNILYNNAAAFYGEP